MAAAGRAAPAATSRPRMIPPTTAAPRPTRSDRPISADGGAAAV